jgi:hypothetical protein
MDFSSVVAAHTLDFIGRWTRNSTTCSRILLHHVPTLNARLIVISLIQELSLQVMNSSSNVHSTSGGLAFVSSVRKDQWTTIFRRRGLK